MDGCRYDHDDMSLVDPSMNLLLCQLQELPCLSLVLICLGFIMRLIESTCPSLYLTNLDLLLYKRTEGTGKIHARLEASICVEFPSLWEIASFLKLIWRDIDGELDI